jgi:hypothetical protein
MVGVRQASQPGSARRWCAHERWIRADVEARHPILPTTRSRRNGIASRRARLGPGGFVDLPANMNHFAFATAETADEP